MLQNSVIRPSCMNVRVNLIEFVVPFAVLNSYCMAL